MRQRREALGLTVRDVAVKVGLRRTSASYLSQLESGAKTPHPALASRLAEALADDPRIYLAWAQTGKRSDPVATARAVNVLAGALEHPAYAGLAAARDGEARPAPAARSVPGTATVRDDDAGGELERAQPLPDSHHRLREASARALPEVTPPARGDEVPRAKLLVPEFDEGVDPGDGAHPAPPPREVHRVAADSLAGIEPPVRPFAFRLSSGGARRVADVLAAGDLAIVSRRAWPLERFAPCAVRLSGHLVLGRVLWNSRQLLLLPGPDASDFVVLDAPDRAALERLVAGRVVARIRDSR